MSENSYKVMFVSKYPHEVFASTDKLHLVCFFHIFSAATIKNAVCEKAEKWEFVPW